MTRVLFGFLLDSSHSVRYRPEEILEAIQELIFPGVHNLPGDRLKVAERYFGSDAWFMISALGRDHSSPFSYKNGVVQTWSKYTSIQLQFIITSGQRWKNILRFRFADDSKRKTGRYCTTDTHSIRGYFSLNPQNAE